MTARHTSKVTLKRQPLHQACSVGTHEQKHLSRHLKNIARNRPYNIRTIKTRKKDTGFLQMISYPFSVTVRHTTKATLKRQPLRQACSLGTHEQKHPSRHLKNIATK